jgi:hypothetical protein
VDWHFVPKFAVPHLKVEGLFPVTFLVLDQVSGWYILFLLSQLLLTNLGKCWGLCTTEEVCLGQGFKMERISFIQFSFSSLIVVSVVRCLHTLLVIALRQESVCELPLLRYLSCWFGFKCTPNDSDHMCSKISEFRRGTPSLCTSKKGPVTNQN